jgi:hypothetical protein
MPYIGRELDSGNYLKLDDISSSFNGSTTTFNLTAAGKAFFPGSAFSILVNLAGVAQEPESAYQINNATITFATAPVAGDQFFCIVLGVAHGINVPGNGTVNGAQLAKPFNYDGYFYLDDANNRVGVGTAIPAKPLHVVGEGQFDSIRILGDLTVDGTTTTLDTVVTEVDRLEVGANNNTVGLAVTQSGSGDAAHFMGGNIGIGTDNPTNTLEISKANNHGITLTRPAGGSNPGTVKFEVHSNGAGRLISERDFNLNFDTDNIGNQNFSVSANGSERLLITSAGLVGIGTNNPGHNLHVYGSFPDFAISDSDTTNDKFRILHNGGGTQLQVDPNNVGPNSSYLLVSVDGTERLRITSAGSIGIGTADPQSQFEVFGSSPIVRSKHSTSQKYTQINHNGTDGYVDWSSGDLILRGASNSEKVRIKSDGLVNITGGIQVTENVTPTSGRGVEIFEGEGGVGQISSYNRDANSWDELRIKGSEVRIYTGTSNGLGLDLAAAQSTLYGTSDGILNLDTTNAGGSFMRFKQSGTIKAWVGSAEGMGGGLSGDQDDLGLRAIDNIMFSANGAERLRITNGGKVLIADDAVVQNNFWGDNIKLQVTDNIASVINSVTYSIYNGGLDIMRARGSSSSPSIVLNNDKLGDVSFYGYNSNDSDANDRFQRAAAITAEVDGTPGSNDDSVPGRLIFSTGTTTTGQPVERLRIDSGGVITINTVPTTNNNANQAVLFQTAAGAINGGSGLLYNPAEDALKVNGNIITSQSFFGAGAGPLMLAVANYSSTQYIKVSNKIEIKGNVGINEANPTVSLDLASNTDAVSLPTGTTAQRPTGSAPYIRKNSTNNALEFYNGTEWVEIITDYFPTGSTILG